MNTSQAQLHQHTFNPWRVKDGTRVVASESMWREPLKWNRIAQIERDHWVASHRGKAACDEPPPERPRVFCASLADVFEDWQKPMVDSEGQVLKLVDPDGWHPEDRESLESATSVRMDHVRQRLFKLIDATPHLDWLLLTKRPENIARMTKDVWASSESESPLRKMMTQWHHYQSPPANLWLGTSVENQQAADERIPHLLKVPAKVRFLSVEPLLVPLDLSRWLVHGFCENCRSNCFVLGNRCRGCDSLAKRLIHWVIVGGESGPHARPCNIEWIRSIVRQCKAAGVKCFVKQLGAKPVWNHVVPGCSVREFIESLELKDSKGGDPDEWPEDLRVREMPEVVS